MPDYIELQCSQPTPDGEDYTTFDKYDEGLQITVVEAGSTCAAAVATVLLTHEDAKTLANWLKEQGYE